MFRFVETDDRLISLHDCRAEKMCYQNGVLSFLFSDGIWVLPQQTQNQCGQTVRTGLAQVDIPILDEEIDGASFYIFKKNRKGKTVREEWEAGCGTTSSHITQNVRLFYIVWMRHIVGMSCGTIVHGKQFE